MYLWRSLSPADLVRAARAVNRHIGQQKTAKSATTTATTPGPDMATGQPAAVAGNAVPTPRGPGKPW